MIKIKLKLLRKTLKLGNVLLTVVSQIMKLHLVDIKNLEMVENLVMLDYTNTVKLKRCSSNQNSV